MFAPGSTVPEGAWGGNQIALTVTRAGAQVEFACAHGTVDQSLPVDSDGRFDVPGSYTADGGPTPASQLPKPARYSGQLHGTTRMDFDVTLTGASQTLASFTLQRGAAATLVKCKID